MTRWLLPVSLALVLTACSSVALAAELLTIEQAIAKSQATGRPILAMAGSKTCGPCQALLQRLSTDVSIAPLVTQFVPLKVDTDGDNWGEWSRKYRPEGKGIPILFVVRADGQMLYGKSGAKSGPELPLFLAEHLKSAGRILSVILFLGGWHFPLITGDPEAESITWLTAIARIGVLHTKIFFVIVFFMWVRWSWPRFRFDQLMNLAWKVMLPLGLVNFLAIAILEEVRHVYAPRWALSDSSNFAWTLGITLAAWAVFVLAWVVTAIANPLVADNRPRRDLSPAEVDSQI